MWGKWTQQIQGMEMRTVEVSSLDKCAMCHCICEIVILMEVEEICLMKMEGVKIEVRVECSVPREADCVYLIVVVSAFIGSQCDN